MKSSWKVLLTSSITFLVLALHVISEEASETPTTKSSEDEDKQESTKTLTPHEKAALLLYERAMESLNEAKPSDRNAAFATLIQSSNLGHEASQELVARAMLFGDDLPRDVAGAVKLLKKLSSRGNPTAQVYLGFVYSIGLGVKANSAKSLLYYSTAAASGDTFASMAMGYRYWNGASVMQSCETALGYYRNAAKKVEEQVSFSGGSIIQRIRLVDEVENPGTFTGVLDDDLIQYYQFLADKGDVQAQVGLGQLHYQGGRGVEQDHARALNYFLQAAEAGNANAMAFLGKMYLSGGSIVKQDNATALKYFEMAAAKNNPVGQSGLGLMYLQGKGVEKDHGKAFKYFSQAAGQGWVDGQLQLGLMYLNGIGVPKDARQAIKYFTYASQSGHILGYYNLAVMHASGTGTLRSCSTAVELFKNVAERGKWGRLLMQAHNVYKEGRTTESFIKYAFLAELGYEVAQSNAAFILDRNEAKDLWSKNDSLIRALMYWSRAAAQGYAVARVKLGDYHYYGCGTKVDYEAAAHQYRLASENQQNAQALFNLGFMHEQGLGLARDLNLAKRYYDQAAESSPDAYVPVLLALIKLAIVYALDVTNGGWMSSGSTTATAVSSAASSESKWSSFLSFTAVFPPTLGPDWDLYLMSTLALILFIVVYLRRDVNRVNGIGRGNLANGQHR